VVIVRGWDVLGIIIGRYVVYFLNEGVEDRALCVVALVHIEDSSLFFPGQGVPCTLPFGREAVPDVIIKLPLYVINHYSVTTVQLLSRSTSSR
jgi:hypothetical protein